MITRKFKIQGSKMAQLVCYECSNPLTESKCFRVALAHEEETDGYRVHGEDIYIFPQTFKKAEDGSLTWEGWLMDEEAELNCYDTKIAVIWALCPAHSKVSA